MSLDLALLPVALGHWHSLSELKARPGTPQCAAAHVSFLEAPENPACPFPLKPKPMYVTPVPFLRPELPQRQPHPPSQMATPSIRLAETSMVSGRDSATLQQRRDNFLHAQRRHDKKQRLKNKPPDDGPPRPALPQRRVHPPRAAAREYRGRGATAAAAPPPTSAEAPAAVNAITDPPVPERTEVETKTITDLRAEVASLHEASTAHGKKIDIQAQTIADQAQTITYLRAEVTSLHQALIALGKNVVNQAQTITDQAQTITDLRDEFAAHKARAVVERSAFI